MANSGFLISALTRIPGTRDPSLGRGRRALSYGIRRRDGSMTFRHWLAVRETRRTRPLPKRVQICTRIRLCVAARRGRQRCFLRNEISKPSLTRVNAREDEVRGVHCKPDTARTASRNNDDFTRLRIFPRFKNSQRRILVTTLAPLNSQDPSREHGRAHAVEEAQWRPWATACLGQARPEESAKQRQHASHALPPILQPAA